MVAADDLRAAVQVRAEALAAGDPAQLRRLLHPGYRWTSHRGHVFDRDGYVAANTGPAGLRWLRQELEQVDVVVVGDTGVVTCVAVDRVEVDGEEREFRMPVTQTWVRVDGDWRCLGGHAGPAG